MDKIINLATKMPTTHASVSLAIKTQKASNEKKLHSVLLNYDDAISFVYSIIEDDELCKQYTGFTIEDAVKDGIAGLEFVAKILLEDPGLSISEEEALDRIVERLLRQMVRGDLLVEGVPVLWQYVKEE